MTIQIIPEGDAAQAGDPNYSGKLGDGEAFVAGNYGTLVFSVATGEVLRYYVQDDPEYADIVKIDVAAYKNKQGNPMQAGDSEDIIFVGFWTEDGKHEPAAEPDPAANFVDEFNADLKRMYGIELGDTGFTETDVRQWYAANEDANACAKKVGEESDLDRIDQGWA